MIETAETRWGTQARRAFRRTPERHPKAHLLVARMHNGGGAFVEPRGHTEDTASLAFVNHGRWLAGCPFCPSAQHASDDGLFYCAHCRNAAAGHRTIPLRWPRGRAGIEAELSCRPDPTSRNWRPGETLADLRRENKERGV